MNRQENEIKVHDYLRVIAKNWSLIGLITGGSFVISIVVSLQLPKVYVATSTILPPKQESSSMNPQLSSGLNSLGAGFLGIKSPVDVWGGILKSRTIRDAIIERFGLQQAFNAPTIEDARTALGEMVSITKSKEDIIFVMVEDKDPIRAAGIANALVEEMDSINKSLIMTSGKSTRVFLQNRLDEARVELEKAEGALRLFQTRNSIIKIDNQAKAIIEAIGSLKGQAMAKEVELQTLLSYAAPTNPNVEILRTEIAELNKKLRELDGGAAPGLQQGGIFIPTGKIPLLENEYVQLLRIVKVQETLHQLLTQQYEMAKIQEVKDSPTVQVLDVAKVPQKKSKPKRSLIVLLSTITAALGSIVLVFIKEYVVRLRAAEGMDR